MDRLVEGKIALCNMISRMGGYYEMVYRQPFLSLVEHRAISSMTFKEVHANAVLQVTPLSCADEKIAEQKNTYESRIGSVGLAGLRKSLSLCEYIELSSYGYSSSDMIRMILKEFRSALQRHYGRIIIDGLLAKLAMNDSNGQITGVRNVLTDNIESYTLPDPPTGSAWSGVGGIVDSILINASLLDEDNVAPSGNLHIFLPEIAIVALYRDLRANYNNCTCDDMRYDHKLGMRTFSYLASNGTRVFLYTLYDEAYLKRKLQITDPTIRAGFAFFDGRMKYTYIRATTLAATALGDYGRTGIYSDYLAPIGAEESVYTHVCKENCNVLKPLSAELITASGFYRVSRFAGAVIKIPNTALNPAKYGIISGQPLTLPSDAGSDILYDEPDVETDVETVTVTESAKQTNRTRK